MTFLITLIPVGLHWIKHSWISPNEYTFVGYNPQSFPALATLLLSLQLMYSIYSSVCRSSGVLIQCLLLYDQEKGLQNCPDLVGHWWSMALQIHSLDSAGSMTVRRFCTTCQILHILNHIIMWVLHWTTSDKTSVNYSPAWGENWETPYSIFLHCFEYTGPLCLIGEYSCTNPCTQAQTVMSKMSNIQSRD